MNKGLFLCGLFIALFLAGCGDDEVKIANQMTLYSRPDTIHLGGDLGMDSILVKGFTACEAYDAKWGTLPGDVAREFDMNASYLYFSYEARVVLLEDSIYDIGIGHFWDEKALSPATIDFMGVLTDVYKREFFTEQMTVSFE